MKALVYKLGGSLLSLPDLAGRLLSLLSTRCDSQPLLIVGGGEAADIVRRWDIQYQLGEERAHWLALQSMMLNESFVATLLPLARIVRSRAEAKSAWETGNLPILCTHDFLKSEERALAGSTAADHEPTALPHNWNVTSDSIAAWVALRWPAAGLVLLKSRPLHNRGCCAGSYSPEVDLENSDHEPAVDPYFPTLAPRLPQIEWINLRTDAPTVETWSSQPAGSSDIPVCAESSNQLLSEPQAERSPFPL